MIGLTEGCSKFGAGQFSVQARQPNNSALARESMVGLDAAYQTPPCRRIARKAKSLGKSWRVQSEAWCRVPVPHEEQG